jgi:hypothetical protein
MGTSDFRIAQLLDTAGACLSVAPVHHWTDIAGAKGHKGMCTAVLKCGSRFAAYSAKRESPVMTALLPSAATMR